MSVLLTTLLALTTFVSSHPHPSPDASPLSPASLARNLRKPTPASYRRMLSQSIQERYLGNSSGLEGSCGDESALVSSISGGYPPFGQVATILANDVQAQALYKQMIGNTSLTALSESVKGTAGANEQGTFTGVTYSSTDPDCWWTYSTCVTPKASYLSPDVYTCPEPQTWGLTFDDGPSCHHDPLYNFLVENNQRATFFFIGANVLTYPLEAQRAITDGHEVCVHTWSHHYNTALTTEQVFAELYYTKKVIKEVLGVTPRCWRPPYGDTDDRVRTIAEFLDLFTVIWDNDTNDWSIDDPGVTAAQIQANFNQIIAAVSPEHGTIVLDHELNPDDMNMFIKMYPSITNAYKHVVPMGTCQNITRPYAEGQYVFPNFASYVTGNRNMTYPTDWTIQPVTNLSFVQTGVTTTTSSSATPSATSSSSIPATTLVSQTSQPSQSSANSNGAKKSGGVVRMEVGKWAMGVAVAVMAGGMMV